MDFPSGDLFTLIDILGFYDVLRYVTQNECGGESITRVALIAS